MSDAPPEPPKKKRRRRRKRPPGPPAPHGDGAPSGHVARPPEARGRGVASPGDGPSALRVIAELDRLAHAIVREQDGGRPPEVELMVPLSLVLGGPARSGERAAALVTALRQRIGEAVRGASAFHEGHVYCFYTDQPDSPYSRPPHATDVFAGYAANGRPEWVGFANLCLRRQEPRVDRLYADSPEIIAVVQMQDELVDGLMPGFGHGSRAYRLLGQVAFGFVPKDLDPRSGAERVALSLQIVATTHGTSAERLRLNVIGLSPEAIAEAAASADATSSAEAFRLVVRATRERVDALGRRVALAGRRGETLDVDAQVRALLGRLRGDLMRVFKVRDYRTRHAEERHQSRERPTALAITDALGAPDGHFYRDERKDTVVVAGPKHRVHVFSRGGRLVTSLEVQPGELARRIDRGRWLPLEKLASELFKDSLKRARQGDD
ncbi:MAG: hypothetical protein U1F43_06240 [Myxococcota bacterium]